MDCQWGILLKSCILHRRGESDKHSQVDQKHEQFNMQGVWKISPHPVAVRMILESEVKTKKRIDSVCLLHSLQIVLVYIFYGRMKEVYGWIPSVVDSLTPPGTLGAMTPENTTRALREVCVIDDKHAIAIEIFMSRRCWTESAGIGSVGSVGGWRICKERCCPPRH